MATNQINNQKQIILLLTQLKEEISAQQLYFKLRQQGSRIGLATVYRNLKSLHLKGVIQERVTSAGESLYSVINQEHHHHLNCISCGQSISINECPITKKLTQWCKSQEFQVYYHTLEFFGLCNSCQH